MNRNLAATIASLSLTTLAAADGALEVVLSSLDTTVPGVPGVVWVPNTFNNPTVDSAGNIAIRGQVGGDGITLANSRLIIRGGPGAWVVVARDGSPVPGGSPADYVFNTTTGTNGLASSNICAANGGLLVSGNINGPGNTTATDTAAYWVPVAGSSVLLAREGDACPGTAGAVLSASFSVSGIPVTNQGEAVMNSALTGGDVTTATNAALIKMSAVSGVSVIHRKGSPAPGFADGTILNHDTFGAGINGSGHVSFGGTLVGGSVTAADDKARFTTVGAPAGSLRMWGREGSQIPGFNSLFFKSGTTIAPANHPLMESGAYLFATDLTGDDVVVGVTDHAIFTENNGTFTKLGQRGDAVSGITDGTFKSVNFNSWLMNAGGTMAFQGILQNPDGTAMATNGTFIGVRGSNGTLTSILRQGDPLPGDSSTLVGSLNGSSDICLSDSGVVVFKASFTGGNAIVAWDESNGLRTVFRTGDTTLMPGATLNTLALIGGAGVNGNSGNTGISDSGVLTFKVRDTTNSIDGIVRVQLDAGSPCAPDLDGNGLVDGADMTILLGNWGGSGTGDLDGNGLVDGADLSVVLSNWGICQ